MELLGFIRKVRMDNPLRDRKVLVFSGEGDSEVELWLKHKEWHLIEIARNHTNYHGSPVTLTRSSPAEISDERVQELLDATNGHEEFKVFFEQ